MRHPLKPNRKTPILLEDVCEASSIEISPKSSKEEIVSEQNQQSSQQLQQPSDYSVQESQSKEQQLSCRESSTKCPPDEAPPQPVQQSSTQKSMPQKISSSPVTLTVPKAHKCKKRCLRGLNCENFNPQETFLRNQGFSEYISEMHKKFSKLEIRDLARRAIVNWRRMNNRQREAYRKKAQSRFR